VLAALAASGLPTDSFLFIGFLPRRRAARQRRLAQVCDQPHTVVCFEAPHRLVAALQDIFAACGDRRLAVACELTKLYEEVWRGTASEAVERFQELRPRGEYTLVIAGASEGGEPAWESSRVKDALTELIASGMSRRDAAAQVAEAARWPRRAVYRLASEQSRPEKGGG
jgi:16S rRNA (cytidine1402-2'-O)-methyltransferase